MYSPVSNGVNPLPFNPGGVMQPYPGNAQTTNYPQLAALLAGYGLPHPGAQLADGPGAPQQTAYADGINGVSHSFQYPGVGAIAAGHPQSAPIQWHGHTAVGPAQPGGPGFGEYQRGPAPGVRSDHPFVDGGGHVGNPHAATARQAINIAPMQAAVQNLLAAAHSHAQAGQATAPNFHQAAGNLAKFYTGTLRRNGGRGVQMY